MGMTCVYVFHLMGDVFYAKNGHISVIVLRTWHNDTPIPRMLSNAN